MHTLVATAIFVVVALPAVLLGKLVHHLETLGISGYLIAVLTALEYVLVTSDALLLTAFVTATMIKAGKEFFK